MPLKITVAGMDDIQSALDRFFEEARAEVQAAMNAEAERIYRSWAHEMSGQSLSYHMSKIRDGEPDA